jgi:predicted DsbA family dithiol-disulfide isomerase
VSRAHCSTGGLRIEPLRVNRVWAYDDAVGVDAEAARAVAFGDRHGDAVREDELLGQRLGIQGVPFFVLDRRYGVSGAQPAEVLLAALERAWGERAAAAA